MISGHEDVTTGSISIGDEVVNQVPPAQRGTAMMFQNYALFPHLNCLDNVAFSMKMEGISKSERYASARKYLELVHMETFEHRFPAQLSVGQEQRIALARALVSHPIVLLLDDWLAGSAEWIQRTVAALCHHAGSALRQFCLSDSGPIRWLPGIEVRPTGAEQRSQCPQFPSA